MSQTCAEVVRVKTGGSVRRGRPWSGATACEGATGSPLHLVTLQTISTAANPRPTVVRTRSPGRLPDRQEGPLAEQVPEAHPGLPATA